MKRALVLLFSVCALGIVSYGLSAQEATAPTEETPAVEAPAPVTDEKVAAPAVLPPAQGAAKTNAKSSPASVKGTPVTASTPASPAADALSLIELNDGDYRSARIPGMTFSKKEPVEAQKNMQSGESSDKSDAKKGVLKRILPLLTVVGLIVFLVLVYRIGRKRRKGNVFRRFP
ncbi:MAG TPA: hypothetical protein VF857_01595 [Spirochaetota bacterium]